MSEPQISISFAQQKLTGAWIEACVQFQTPRPTVMGSVACTMAKAAKQVRRKLAFTVLVTKTQLVWLVENNDDVGWCTRVCVNRHDKHPERRKLCTFSHLVRLFSRVTSGPVSPVTVVHGRCPQLKGCDLFLI